MLAVPEPSPWAFEPGSLWVAEPVSVFAVPVEVGDGVGVPAVALDVLPVEADADEPLEPADVEEFVLVVAPADPPDWVGVGVVVGVGDGVGVGVGDGVGVGVGDGVGVGVGDGVGVVVVVVVVPPVGVWVGVGVGVGEWAEPARPVHWWDREPPELAFDVETRLGPEAVGAGVGVGVGVMLLVVVVDVVDVVDVPDDPPLIDGLTLMIGCTVIVGALFTAAIALALAPARP